VPDEIPKVKKKNEKKGRGKNQGGGVSSEVKTRRVKRPIASRHLARFNLPCPNEGGAGWEGRRSVWRASQFGAY